MHHENASTRRIAARHIFCRRGSFTFSRSLGESVRDDGIALTDGVSCASKTFPFSQGGRCEQSPKDEAENEQVRPPALRSHDEKALQDSR